MSQVGYPCRYCGNLGYRQICETCEQKYEQGGGTEICECFCRILSLLGMFLVYFCRDGGWFGCTKFSRKVCVIGLGIILIFMGLFELSLSLWANGPVEYVANLISLSFLLLIIGGICFLLGCCYRDCGVCEE